MAKQTVLTKKRRGPLPTGKGTLVGVRMQPHPLSDVDDWAARQDDKPGRSEAIRRLVEIGLKASAHSVLDLKEAESHGAKAKKLAAELGLKVKK